MSDEPRDSPEEGDRSIEAGRPRSTEPPAPDSSHVPSAPWERPRRWNQDALDATRVDDLLARLGSGEDLPSGRRRRRQAGAQSGAGVAASDLIAALSGEGDSVAANPDPDEPKADHHSAQAPAAVIPQAPVPSSAPDAVAGRPTSVPEAQAHPEAEPFLEAEPVPEIQPSTAAQPLPATPEPVPAPEQPTAVQPEASASVPSTPQVQDPAALPSAHEGTVLLPPRVGAYDPAPIRDLGDDPRTDYIPKMTGSVAERAEADSILASLRKQSQTGADTAGAGAVYGSGTVPPTPPGPPGGRSGRRGPSDPPPRRRRGLLYAGRGIAAAVALITLLGMGVEWKIKDNADSGLRQNQIVAPLPTANSNVSTARTAPVVTTNSKGVTTTESAVPKTTFAPENILLLGSDSRYGKNAIAGTTGSSTGDTSQSDTLMVAHISGDRSHVTLLSIPRDTLIPAPTCKAWNPDTGVVSDQEFPVSPGQTFHINNAYAVGGPICTVTAVQNLTHLGITRVIGIDFEGFQAMVDALGGIDVNICRPIVDTVLGTVVPRAGQQKIFGRQALILVRARDVIGDDESDLARIRRQQVVLSAILRQVTQAGTLLNPAKLNSFLHAFTENTFTKNVTVDDLVTLAGSLGSLDPAHVTFYTLPTVPSTTVDGALDVDETKAPAIFDDLVNDLPLPGEVATPATTRASSTATPTPSVPSLRLTVAPARVDLEIYNLTGVANVAGTAQQKLNAVGFAVSDDQLYKPDTESQTGTTVLYAAANRAAALTVAAAVPGSTLVVTAGLGKTVRLDLGSSFSGTTRAVKIGDTAPSSLATVSTGPSISTSSSAGSRSSVALSSVNAGAGSCV